MKKSILSIVAASTLFTSVANADFIGVEIGGAGWAPEMTGDFKYKGTTMDLKDDLGFGDDESASYGWVSVEHPVPVIPNVKIIQTNLEMDATSASTASVTFNDKVYNSGAIATDMTLNQTDYILYYELSEGLIIPFVHLDVGLAVKNLEGEITLVNNTLNYTETKDFSVPVPMAYAKIKLSTSTIPFFPDVEFETLQLSIGDNKFEDTKIGIVYDFELVAGFNAGFVAGLRKESFEVDESNVTANVDVEGYYFGAYFNW